MIRFVLNEFAFFKCIVRFGEQLCGVDRRWCIMRYKNTKHDVRDQQSYNMKY